LYHGIVTENSRINEIFIDKACIMEWL
jgi:hypothetical protein